MMKNFKAPGFDEITNEEIKLIEHIKPDLIHSVLQRIWESETCPDEFRRSIIYLFPKPSKLGKEKDHRFQKNHRPISLLPTLRKLYEVILSSRLLNILKLNKTQFGFLKGISTSDCIFLLIESILQARYVSRGPKGGRSLKLYAAFLDFMGAFDRVPRALVWDKLCSKFGVKGKLLRVIVDLFTDTNARAMVNGYLTRNFPIESGVLQGSVLGPTLFLLFIDDLLDELQTSTLGIPMWDFVLSVLAFADDITLLSLAKKNV